MTRPDIGYAVSIVSQFMSARTVKHWVVLEQILCCLKGAEGTDGILFRDSELQMLTKVNHFNLKASKTYKNLNFTIWFQI